MRTIRAAVAQLNTRVGAIQANTDMVLATMDKAAAGHADLLVLPELVITGYPPEDLVFKPQFLAENQAALNQVAAASAGKNILIFCGFVNRTGSGITNSAAVIHDGRIVDIYSKIFLPNYGVFDERRYFETGSRAPVYLFKNARIGITICEDIWYPTGPMHYQTVLGDAEIVLNLSASPFHAGKQDYREKMFSARAGDETAFLINCNAVGGQDELVFDGASTVYNEDGQLIERLMPFEGDLRFVTLDCDRVTRKRLKDIRRRQEREMLSAQPPALQVPVITVSTEPAPAHTLTAPSPAALPQTVESIYQALVLGTKDYITKNGFDKVLIAVSGGVDSALVAAIAVDALGPDRVKGIYLPSQFSADISGIDAFELGRRLGFEMLQIPISGLFDSMTAALRPVFLDTPFGLAEENLQSRIRGNLVMAISNKFNYLVLTTGNKSEMSTGYATLYGDMAGGFAVIKDVLKTTVYELCHYRNRHEEVIPDRIITRPPSAELRPDQKDSDSLPEYPVLDHIIRCYVEEDKPAAEIGAEIGDMAVVKKVIRMIDLAEYKRRQAPPGVKITPRAFGRDRRMPITSGFRA